MVRDKIIFAILLPCAAIETDTQSARQILKILEEEIGKSLGLKLYAKSDNNLGRILFFINKNEAF